MDLFTIQLSKWRVARNRDIVFMDTTVKSGNSIFAPSWEMVLGHKAWLRSQEHPGQGTGRQELIDDAAYRELYWERMNSSYKSNRAKWNEVIRMEEPLAIACYCRPGAFCHRHLLKEIFEKLCKHEGLPFYYYGELT